MTIMTFTGDLEVSPATAATMRKHISRMAPPPALLNEEQAAFIEQAKEVAIDLALFLENRTRSHKIQISACTVMLGSLLGILADEARPGCQTGITALMNVAMRTADRVMAIEALSAQSGLPFETVFEMAQAKNLSPESIAAAIDAKLKADELAKAVDTVTEEDVADVITAIEEKVADGVAS